MIELTLIILLLIIQAEELIKQEMITMLHYDNLHNLIAVDNLQASKKPALTSPIQHLEYLENHPYEEFADEQLEIVRLFFFIFKNNILLIHDL